MSHAIESRPGSIGASMQSSGGELFATLQMPSDVRGAVSELVVGRRHYLVAIAEVDCIVERSGELRIATDTRVSVSSAAPYLPGAEIALVADAWKGPLRLRVGRASVALVDKIALRGAFEWPIAPPVLARASHHTGVMPRAELLADPDFSRFHSVAPDQRLSWLAGSEWFEVDGPFGVMRGALPRIELRCRVELSTFVGNPEPLEPIMALDRLVVCPQRGVVTLGGRCHLEVGDRATLDAVHFSFGLGVSGAEILWGSDLGDSGTRARPSLAKPPTTVPPRNFGGTMLIEPPAGRLTVDATADTLPAESSACATLIKSRAFGQPRLHTLELDGVPKTLPFLK